MFKKLKKTELQNIYLDYCCSKENGRRCESLVPFAEQYKEQKKIKDFMTLSPAIDIVTKMFFEEVANRYLKQALNNDLIGGLVYEMYKFMSSLKTSLCLIKDIKIHYIKLNAKD